jgi:cytochrome c oxidase assembly protein Cox11
MKNVKSVTLSYTFFKTNTLKDEEKSESQPEAQKQS